MGMKPNNLQEKLAIERTKMAEERTHLAYIRTGLSMILGGLFFVGYFHDNTLYSAIGWAGTAMGALFLGYGFYIHHRFHGLLGILRLRKMS